MGLSNLIRFLNCIKQSIIAQDEALFLSVYWYFNDSARGFDFLGYHFKLDGLSVAKKTVKNFIQHIARLYEQDAGHTSIGQYIKLWFKWLRSGLDENIMCENLKTHLINVRPLNLRSYI